MLDIPRYFIAMILPDEAKDRLVALQPNSSPALRLIDRDELHLTLHFLGELETDAEVTAVRRTLAGVRGHSVSLRISGVGTFPAVGRPEVIWARVELSLALAALHNEIGAALEKEIGFRPETRPYFPHITLARIRDPVSRESIDQYLIDRRDFAVWEFPVAQMGLYSSRFRGNMPSYVAEAVFSVA